MELRKSPHSPRLFFYSLPLMGIRNDRDLESAEFLDDAGKVKQPKWLRRQGGFPYLLYVTTQLCGMEFSRA